MRNGYRSVRRSRLTECLRDWIGTGEHGKIRLARQMR